MCAIFGASYPADLGNAAMEALENQLAVLWYAAAKRGRDGAGLATVGNSEHTAIRGDSVPISQRMISGATAIVGNRRAEPTTEFVREKHAFDQQPYELHDWIVVHNGTIANDKELRTHELRTSIDSAAIVELLQKTTDNGGSVAYAISQLHNRLVGSYAILALHKPTQRIFAVANYRPIWLVKLDHGALAFVSSRHGIPTDFASRMVPPYSVVEVARGEVRNWYPFLPKKNTDESRALVVCSGGLDSTVVAAYAAKEYGEIELLHFEYGSRAQTNEWIAVQAVALALGCAVRRFPMPIYTPEDSPLLRPAGELAGGEKGAEYAHEWVPARNLVMLSIATAYAEANGFDVIMLGNNLEEAGAYPDNEPEFIDRFAEILPFAVADGKRVSIATPVGNMMKHEIVSFGLQLNAPLDRTWSCYRNGRLHCGRCGPCYMRRKAFEINNVPEVIRYETE